MSHEAACAEGGADTMLAKHVMIRDYMIGALAKLLAAAWVRGMRLASLVQFCNFGNHSMQKTA